MGTTSMGLVDAMMRVTTLKASAADAIEPRFRCAVLLAAFVGLRKGELLGLRRCDLEFGTRQLTVAQQRQLDRHGAHIVGPPKTDAGRRTITTPAAIVPNLRAHLVEYAQSGAEGYVFTGFRGDPLAPHVLHEHWSKARAGLGLGHLHFHDLRHLVRHARRKYRRWHQGTHRPPRPRQPPSRPPLPTRHQGARPGPSPTPSTV